MESFFAKPTPEKIANFIYCQILVHHEMGLRGYRYEIPNGMSVSFVNEIIDCLGYYILDVDTVELQKGYIVVDWS